jgi:hypothetical protein
MLEALITSGNYRQESEFAQRQATSDILARRNDAFANPGLQRAVFGALSVQRAPKLYPHSFLTNKQSPFESEFALAPSKDQKEPPTHFNISSSGFKNLVLLGEVKGLLSKGEIIKAHQLLEKALIAGHRFSEPLLKLHDALSPGRVNTSSVKTPHRKYEASWIKANRAAYTKKWVAVLGEQVIASGDTFKQVLAAVKQQKLSVSPVIHYIE